MILAHRKTATRRVIVFSAHGFLSLLLLVCGCTGREAPAASSALQQIQTPLWSGAVPDAQPVPKPEIDSVETKMVAEKPWHWLTNVTQPTLTVFQPTRKNTGAAVIVFPGGGYKGLAIDLEGTEVCDWLTAKGITCIVLKYRVPDSGPHWEIKCQCQVIPKTFTALQDAQRAVSYTRFNAFKWHIDSHKLGVLGFSAGGHLVAAVSTHFSKRQYAPRDAADAESSRPDFAIALYPGHLFWGKNSWIENTLLLNPDIRDHVTSQAPPTFLLQNEDDRVDSVFDSLSYYVALRRSGARVELHSYATGGHAFGLRHTKQAATEWPKLVERWLVSIGIVK